MNFLSVMEQALIRFEVVLYTAVGGIKATFLTDFLHTTIAIILIIFFTLSVLTNEHVGGLHGLYDKVSASATQHHVVGNYAGSLLTFKSKGAIMFGLILKFGNLALVVMVRVVSNRFMISLTSYSRILLFGKSPLPRRSDPQFRAMILLHWPYLRSHGA